MKLILGDERMSGLQYLFHYIPRVFDGVEVRAICRAVKHVYVFIMNKHVTGMNESQFTISKCH